MVPVLRASSENEAGGQSEGMPGEQCAPWCAVPAETIISIEHPCVVQNVANIIETLGGSTKIEKLLGNPKTEAELFLRPEDRIAKSIGSSNLDTNNVVLLITVPKRTGRWRPRNSTEPYQSFSPNRIILQQSEDPSKPSKPATLGQSQQLLKSLQDNPGRYTILPVGVVKHTHRFRVMPDFGYSTANGSFMNKVREYILPHDYLTSKKYQLDLGKGVKHKTELLPPPVWSPILLPFNYSYLQNPSVKQVVDAMGNVTTVNPQMSRKILTHHVPYDEPLVPTVPSSKIPALATLDAEMKRLVDQLQECMNERPIWTRRALTNQLQSREWCTTGKHLYQYVGYTFRSGPWRETVIRYGVDPRSNPKYRIFQTMMFQFDNQGNPRKEMKRKRHQAKTARGGPRLGPINSQKLKCGSHIFDGVHAEADGKTWQVCDVTDPIIQKILATTNIRRRCHLESDGWYHNGTWQKARVILRAKITNILAGKGSLKDSDFARVMAMPDILEKGSGQSHIFRRSDGVTADELDWLAQVRTLASAPETGGGEELLKDDEKDRSKNSQGSSAEGYMSLGSLIDSQLNNDETILELGALNDYTADDAPDDVGDEDDVDSSTDDFDEDDDEGQEEDEALPRRG